MTLPQFVEPEIRRKRLEEVVLQIKILEQGKARPFLEKFMDPPDPQALNLAMETLNTLNALDKDEQLTPLGFHLSKLPMDPHTGKMILMGAMFSCIDPILSVAASLSFKDPFVTPLGKEQEVDSVRREFARGCKSDHLMIANVMMDYEEAKRSNDGNFCWDHFLSPNTLNMLENLKRDLAAHLCELGFLESKNFKAQDVNRNSNNEDLVRAIICSGLYPNVAEILGRKGITVKLRTATDKKVAIHPKSVNAKETNFKSQWLVYHLKIRSGSSNVDLFDCGEVSPMALLFFGQGIQTRTEALSNGDEAETIVVDKLIKFNCEMQTSEIFLQLRSALDDVLEYKALHPGVTNWRKSSKEGAILTTITELLCSNS